MVQESKELRNCRLGRYANTNLRRILILVSREAFHLRDMQGTGPKLRFSSEYSLLPSRISA